MVGLDARPRRRGDDSSVSRALRYAASFLTELRSEGGGVAVGGGSFSRPSSSSSNSGDIGGVDGSAPSDAGGPRYPCIFASSSSHLRTCGLGRGDLDVERRGDGDGVRERDGEFAVAFGIGGRDPSGDDDDASFFPVTGVLLVVANGFGFGFGFEFGFFGSAPSSSDSRPVS